MYWSVFQTTFELRFLLGEGRIFLGYRLSLWFTLNNYFSMKELAGLCGKYHKTPDFPQKKKKKKKKNCLTYEKDWNKTNVSFKNCLYSDRNSFNDKNECTHVYTHTLKGIHQKL